MSEDRHKERIECVSNGAATIAALAIENGFIDEENAVELLTAVEYFNHDMGQGFNIGEECVDAFNLIMIAIAEGDEDDEDDA